MLQAFLSRLNKLDWEGDFTGVKAYMDGLGKSPDLWHYTEKKKEFLVEWLRPYQEQFGKPIEELTAEELQASIRIVEELRNTRMEEMTHLVEETDRNPFGPYNRRMHPIVNGKNAEFWGSRWVILPIYCSPGRRTICCRPSSAA